MPIKIPSFSFVVGPNINRDTVDNDHYKTDHMLVLSSNNHIFSEQSPTVVLLDPFPDIFFQIKHRDEIVLVRNIIYINESHLNAT